MKQHRLRLLLGVLTVFAAVGVMSASAFANDLQWLVDGAAITEPLSADVEGSLELTDLNVPLFGESTVKCESILDGTVGSGDADEITEVLNTKGEKRALICKGVKGACGTGAEAAEVEAENLPWNTGLALGEGGTMLDVQFGSENQPGYRVKCKSSGLEDLCEGFVSSVLTNNAELGDVTEKFSLEEQEKEAELAECTQGGKEAGHIAGEGLVLLTGTEAGLTLAVSEQKEGEDLAEFTPTAESGEYTHVFRAAQGRDVTERIGTIAARVAITILVAIIVPLAPATVPRTFQVIRDCSGALGAGRTCEPEVLCERQRAAMEDADLFIHIERAPELEWLIIELLC